MKKLVYLGITLMLLLLTAQWGYCANKKDSDKTHKVPVSKFEFEDYTTDDEWMSISLEEAGNHSLGDDIAKKFCLVDKLYVSRSQVAPGNPAVRTYVRKPEIYNSLRKIDRFFRKSIRKDICSEEEAHKIINHILDVAIALQVNDTKEFEKVLKRNRKAEDQIEIYKNTKLISLYE